MLKVYQSKDGKDYLYFECDVCHKPANREAGIYWEHNNPSNYKIACCGNCAMSINVSFPSGWVIGTIPGYMSVRFKMGNSYFRLYEIER